MCFVSLQDHLDTTTAQGRLMFNLFASLADFKRDIIRERTYTGLGQPEPEPEPAAARAAGPKAFSRKVLHKVQAAKGSAKFVMFF